MSDNSKIKSKPNERGLLLGIICISILLGLVIIFGIFESKFESTKWNISDIFGSFYFLTLGLMFLASYFYENKSFFFRALIWVCLHLSVPAKREMAIGYFLLAVFLSVFSFLHGVGIVR